MRELLIICRIQNPDIPRAGRVGAAQSGAAGRRRAGQDGKSEQFAKRQLSLVPSKASSATVLNGS